MEDIAKHKEKMMSARQETQRMAIETTVKLSEIARKHMNRMSMSEVKGRYKASVEKNIANMWEDVDLSIFSSKVEEGKEFAGFRISGENWRVNPSLSPKTEQHVYLGQDVLRETFLLAGGNTQQADELFSPSK